MNDRYDWSGPEEGDKVDMTVLVIDTEGPVEEILKVRAGTLAQQKAMARRIAALLNKADAELLV